MRWFWFSIQDCSTLLPQQATSPGFWTWPWLLHILWIGRFLRWLRADNAAWRRTCSRQLSNLKNLPRCCERYNEPLDCWYQILAHPWSQSDRSSGTGRERSERTLATSLWFKKVEGWKNERQFCPIPSRSQTQYKEFVVEMVVPVD